MSSVCGVFCALHGLYSKIASTRLDKIYSKDSLSEALTVENKLLWNKLWFWLLLLGNT